MNLILFEEAEEEVIITPDDPRFLHLRDVLRLVPGDTFDVAVANGPHGKAILVTNNPDGMHLSLHWQGITKNDLLSLRLVLGLPRPQTARKILEQGTALGVATMDFFGADKGEPSYADSKLWTTDEWRGLLVKGVEQAFCSFLPQVSHWNNLESVLKALPEEGSRLALDVYEAEKSLSTLASGDAEPAILALGPERGWSSRERDLLRQNGFSLLHMGKRVLRQETACIAALGILASNSWEA